MYLLKQAEEVATHGEMLEKIKAMVIPGDLIFLKGSRKMELEKVVEGLEAQCFIS